LTSKLHAICDGAGRPLRLHLTAGQVSDYLGAEALMGNLPSANLMIGDRGYDANWFRTALHTAGIEACIPPKRNRVKAVYFNKIHYRVRHKVENMFAKLKDWRRIATRYDRSAQNFIAAIKIAAIIIFWNN